MGVSRKLGLGLETYQIIQSLPANYSLCSKFETFCLHYSFSVPYHATARSRAESS